MKVFFTIKTLAYAVGGAEKLVCALAGLLVSRGFEVHLLTFDSPEAPPFFDLHPAVIRHYAQIGDPSKRMPMTDLPRLLLSIRREIAPCRPDVVVSFMHSSFIPVIMALAGTGIPVVLSEHTTPTYYARRKLQYMALRVCSLFAKSITIVSSRIAALYPPEMRKKMVLLSNPVFSDFSLARASQTEGRKTVLSVGRLDQGKDHAVLIEAFAKIAKDMPDWDLLIVGEGPERARLESMIKGFHLGSRASLPGVVKDLAPIYKSSSLFVFPSRYENFGMVTAEAMSYSLPVIGFQDCTGTNELVVHNKNGLLVEHRSAEKLGAAMLMLMERADLRVSYGATGRTTAEAYNPENVGKEWACYLMGLVSKSPKKV